MQTSPLVSIVTPVFNQSKYIEELILSVKSQDYPHIEHIVIDDGSTDNGATVAVLERYPHLRWWSRENRGQYATMNEGLLAAKGVFVCFVSADDKLSSGAVKSAVEFFQMHPDFDGVFGMTNYIDINSKNYPYPVPFQRAPLSFYAYFAHISHCSLYLKVSSLQKHGLLFNPALHYVGDYEWMIRVYKSRLRIGTLNRELSKVRIHEAQASRKFLAESVKEKQAVLETQNINKLYYACLWALYVLRVRIWKIASAYKENGIQGVAGLLSKLVRVQRSK
jgi:glycosyltransferase involved in cell wall biosynthesis